MKKLLALTIVAGTATALASACAPKTVNNVVDGDLVPRNITETVVGYGSKANASHVGAIKAVATSFEGVITEMKIDETITYAKAFKGADLNDAPEILPTDAAALFWNLIDRTVYTIKKAATYEGTDKICYTYTTEFNKSVARPNVFRADDCAANDATEVPTAGIQAGRAYNGKTGTSQLSATADNKLADANGVAADAAVVTYVAGTVKAIDNVKANLYKPTAYSHNGKAVYTTTIDAIEGLFIGKTKSEIEALSVTKPADVAGATLNYTTDYFFFAKAAALKALA